MRCQSHPLSTCNWKSSHSEGWQGWALADSSYLSWVSRNTFLIQTCKEETLCIRKGWHFSELKLLPLVARSAVISQKVFLEIGRSSQHTLSKLAVSAGKCSISPRVSATGSLQQIFDIFGNKCSLLRSLKAKAHLFEAGVWDPKPRPPPAFRGIAEFPPSLSRSSLEAPVEQRPASVLTCHHDRL